MHAASLPAATLEMLFQELLSLLTSAVHQAGAGPPLQSAVHRTTNFQQETGLFNTRFTVTNVCTATASVGRPQRLQQSQHRTATQEQCCKWPFRFV